MLKQGWRINVIIQELIATFKFLFKSAKGKTNFFIFTQPGDSLSQSEKYVLLLFVN